MSPSILLRAGVALRKPPHREGDQARGPGIPCLSSSSSPGAFCDRRGVPSAPDGPLAALLRISQGASLHGGLFSVSSTKGRHLSPPFFLKF